MPASLHGVSASPGIVAGTAHLLRWEVPEVPSRVIDDAEIERYLAGGEWHGKAGGYAIQGAAAAFIPSVGGSYSNVVGLSLSDAYAMLTGLGFRP